MPIHETTPTEAYETLKNDSSVVYIDVRTEGEFEQGHPEGAYNVPVLFADPAGGPATQNADFVSVVERHFGHDTAVLVGCMSGGRSSKACTMLEQAGYTNLSNVQGGFGGTHNRSGEVVTKR